MCRKHIVLERPELLGKVNVVVVRIAEAANLVPHTLDLLGTVLTDLGKRGERVDLLAVFKHLNEQLGCRIILKRLALPGRYGVKDLERLCIVDRLIVKADQVSLSLAGLATAESVDLLEVRCGDLAHVLADLYLGDDISLLVPRRRASCAPSW